MKNRGYAAEAIQKAAIAEQQGDTSSALGWIKQAAASEPREPAIHHIVAKVAMRLGDAELALSSMGSAVELSPQDHGLRFQFACLLAHQGMPISAIEHFRLSLLQQPKNAEGWRLLGVALQRLGRHTEALLPLRNALELDPNSIRILETLAESEFHAGYPDDALPLLLKLHGDFPERPLIALRLAETFNRLGRHQEAYTLLSSAARMAEHPEQLLVSLAQTAEDMGNRDAARNAYRAALEAKPGWVSPMSGLLGLDRSKADDSLVEQSVILVDDDSVPDSDRALLGYELGKVLDGRRRYVDAMHAWHQANLARQRMIGPANLGTVSCQIDRTIDTWTKSKLQELRRKWPGSSDPRPVFVVGMPRSGTTLTEQILAAHPSAFGCGELPDIALIVRNLPLEVGPDAIWPSCVDGLRGESLNAAATRYLRAATRGAPESAYRLVDKAPLNFYELGLISLLFPQARVIWCRRDPRDIAISVYGENFALDERLANDLGDIGRYISFQTRLMRHWQRTLSLPILELVYEQLVTDTPQQAKRIIEFAGLPWHPACLEFHQSDRGVQTPSRWQVKQPIYTHSIARWKNYETYLAPLLATLEPDAYPSWLSDAGCATQDQATTPSC